MNNGNSYPIHNCSMCEYVLYYTHQLLMTTSYGTSDYKIYV